VPNFIQSNFKEAPSLNRIKFGSLTDSEDPTARYRALRRLAVQGNDYDQERRFFEGELRAIRRHSDKWKRATFWLGHLYELFSDFGRSLSRPIVAWLLVTSCFAFVYYWLFRKMCNDASCGWPEGWLGPGLYAAIVNSVPGLGLVGGNGRALAIACINGRADWLTPGIDLLFTLQSILSVILSFLFILAIRNYLRIK
jgi:hypothetical protein